MNKDEFTFEGFEPANTTAVPDVLFDVLLPHLSEAELKVLLYIIRRTAGFKKSEDAISFSQFQNGITTRDGKVLDHGCGVKNRTALSRALISLEKKGCIFTEKCDAPQGDKAVTVYKIRFHNEGVVRETYQGSTPSVPPVVRDEYHRSTQDAPGVVRETYPQDTVIQETDNKKQLDKREESAPPVDLNKWKEESGKHKAIPKQELPPMALTPAQIQKQLNARVEQILVLYGTLIGRKPSRSKPNMDGALKLAQDDVSDEDITTTTKAILADSFLAKNLSLTFVYSKLDALCQKTKPPSPPAQQQGQASQRYKSFTGAGQLLQQAN